MKPISHHDLRDDVWVDLFKVLLDRHALEATARAKL